MDTPEALLDDQHRYGTEPVAHRPFTSFAYRLLVIGSLDDFIVEIHRLAVFAVGKFGKVSLVGFDHFRPPVVSSQDQIGKWTNGGRFVLKADKLRVEMATCMLEAQMRGGDDLATLQ
jgi:hypothetical protein